MNGVRDFLTDSASLVYVLWKFSKSNSSPETFLILGYIFR
jgi:hypothetical protein